MASFVEMYADESYGGNDAKGHLHLAMYLYEREQAVSATKEWLSVLNDPELPRPLPFFRMSDCAHAQGVFAGMQEHCDRIARKLIPIPKARSIIGFATSVDQAEYARIMPPSQGFPNPYTFLTQMCLTHIANWVSQTGYSGQINFYFEAGHNHRADVNRLMEEIRDNKTARRSAFYADHAFIEKRELPLLQSADLLAWHSFTDLKRRALGQGMRKDLMALGRPQDKVQRWTSEQLLAAVPHVHAHNEITELITKLNANFSKSR